MTVQTGYTPQWSVPGRVKARVTLRDGGVSVGPFGRAGGRPGGLNLGSHVGDDPQAVQINRARLASQLPGPVHWLEQVHGCAVYRAGSRLPDVAPIADAAISTQPGAVIAVLTADCLPVLVADAAGRGVAVIHAGWRGLAGGVIEATLSTLRQEVGPDLRPTAWLGPAIGPQAFEVGDEVRQAFVEADPAAQSAFLPGRAAGKWWADLYTLARQRLGHCGVDAVAGTPQCTVSDPGRFYSYRRDGRTGRFASLIWLDPD